MSARADTIIFPVSDLPKATQLFRTLLGTEPVMDEPYYVGFRIDGQDIGLDPKGHRNGTGGPTCYREVDDIEQARQQLLDAGAVEVEPVHDVGGGKLIAVFSDANGSPIGISKSPW
jgi:predicted enzyme related to lactoylglutathione lyase